MEFRDALTALKTLLELSGCLDWLSQQPWSIKEEVWPSADGVSLLLRLGFLLLCEIVHIGLERARELFKLRGKEILFRAVSVVRILENIEGEELNHTISLAI